MLGSQTDAEDIVQNVLLKAHQNGTRPDDVRAWLYSITRNEVYDHLRRRRAQATALSRLAADAETAEEPGRAAETADAVEQVSRALAALPEQYRDVLALRFQQHLKFEEIAKVLGLPLGTVKVQAARGLKLLRQNLKGVL